MLQAFIDEYLIKKTNYVKSDHHQSHVIEDTLTEYIIELTLQKTHDRGAAPPPHISDRGVASIFSIAADVRRLHAHLGAT